MRCIDLRNEFGRIHEDAYIRLMVYSYFPESETDRQQALALYAIERERFQSIGEQNYVVSATFKSLINKLSRQTGQIYTCGSVVLAMCELDGKGQEMSLNKAAKIVEEMNGEYRRIEWVSYFENEPTTKGMKTLSSIKDIKDAFRKYQSVAHFCAAWATTGEYLTPRHLFDRAPEAEACVIATAMFYQQKLARAPRAPYWNLWDVLTKTTDELRAYPPLLPSREVIDGVFAPYLELENARKKGVGGL